MAVTNDAIPFFDPGATITGHVTAAVTGKRFVRISGARTDGNVSVAPANAGADIFGVAAADAPVGSKVTILRPTAVVPVTSAAALTAGASVTSDATGQVVAAAAGARAVGRLLDDVAIGEDAQVALEFHNAA